MTIRLIAAIAALTLALPAYCQAPAAPSGPVPPGTTARRITSGILRYEAVLSRGDGMRVWVYLPERPAAAKIPCVAIAPAGSHGFDGMKLGDGDIAEHLPWVRAGFAVVSYEIDGVLDVRRGEAGIPPAIRSFMAAQAGLANTRSAINFATKFAAVDPERLYVAGHSSAATLALLVAETDSRIKGCVAFAPVVDVPKQLQADGLLDPLAQMVPGFREFAQTYSPQAGVATLKCPLFLFQAEDDDRLPIAATAAFAEAAKKVQPNVTFARVPSGGHYEPMIKEGIPMAIAWVKQLKADTAPK